MAVVALSRDVARRAHAPATPVVRARDVRFAYGNRREIVHIPEFVVEASTDVLLLGPSGCGKTTFLHLLAGLLTPTHGSVIVLGQDFGRLTARARDRFRGRHIGIVLQQFHLLPTLTVLENLLVAQSIAGLPVDRSAALSMLESLAIADRKRAMPHELSVGQQQRVAIARALVNRPQLLLADEPTSNLDDESCATVADLLLEAAHLHGASLVIATHDSRLKARVPRHVPLSRASGVQS
jgi:putative ABC transport system ATP-binding protein